MTQPRAAEVLVATKPSSTNIAPIAASPMMKTSDQLAAVRTRSPFGQRRASHHNATTKISATPLLSRWVSSIKVSTAGSVGITSPLHKGQ